MPRWKFTDRSISVDVIYERSNKFFEASDGSDRPISGDFKVVLTEKYIFPLGPNLLCRITGEKDR